ncbi:MULTISPECIES: hypothetical protein [Grimontia]|uniref:hypothetical protein n=1 Tax=Grimontia TaxID=246861 RepID=UPI00068DF171|nr:MULTISPECIES: hypothetical protein [Grimontia]
MEFNPNYGVYVCEHVFRKTRPVRYSVRDADGDWQFLCGVPGCVDEGEPHLVGVGHLIEMDNSIRDLATLEPMMSAVRKSIHQQWIIRSLERDDSADS